MSQAAQVAYVPWRIVPIVFSRECISGKVTRYIEIDGVLRAVDHGGAPLPVAKLAPVKRAPATNRLAQAYAFWGWTGCVVPGCARGPRLHHIVPRREGGSNRLNNLLPICEYHETPIHRAGSAYRRMIGVARLSRKENQALNKASRATDIAERLHAKSHAALAGQPLPEPKPPKADRLWWLKVGRARADFAYHLWANDALSS